MPTTYMDSRLKELSSSACRMEAREPSKYLRAFLDSQTEGKLLALFGLRRTGKTIMMLQSAAIDPAKSIYMSVSEKDDIDDVSAEIGRLREMGYRRFFVDEITKARDFARYIDEIADSHAMMGCHIVMAGTDSLNFSLAATKALGRIVKVNVTRIPFLEHARLFPGLSFADYARCGGILDKTSLFDLVVDGKDEEYKKKLAQGYTLRAIAENIQRSLSSFQGVWPGRLARLCAANEMTSIINFAAHYDSHRLLIEAVNKEFSSEDINEFMGLARKLEGFDIPDKRTLSGLHRKNLSIVNVDEREIRLDQDLLDEIESVLHEINAMTRVRRIVMHPSGKTFIQNENVFNQPAIRWGQVESLIEAIAELDYGLPPFLIKNLGKIAFGKTFEDALFLEASEAFSRMPDSDVVRFSYVDGKVSAEADIVIAMPDKRGFYAFETKTRENPARKDSRHLRNSSFIARIERLYGPLLGWKVIRPTAERHDEVSADSFVREMLPELKEKTICQERQKRRKADYVNMKP